MEAVRAEVVARIDKVQADLSLSIADVDKGLTTFAVENGRLDLRVERLEKQGK